AQIVLVKATFIKQGERRHAQALIKGWLSAYEQLNAAAEAAEHAEAQAPPQVAGPGRLAQADLRAELERFKSALRAGGLRESTIHACLLGSSLFVRWLAGDDIPGARRT
ncbi:MAG: hypothetical protein LC777_17460, partial [Actinobacteria bacterium]|nr:hypothetical protein [Actinomycetota bacterium]